MLMHFSRIMLDSTDYKDNNFLCLWPYSVYEKTIGGRDDFITVSWRSLSRDGFLEIKRKARS